jgi:hypothetical protein
VQVKRAVVLAVALALASACAGKTRPAGGIQEDSKRVKARVVVNVTGAETIEYSDTTTIIIYRTLDTRVPLGVRLFSVGIPPPHVPYAEGASFRAAFDVLGYRPEAKEYSVPPNVIGTSVPGPSGVPLPSGIQSNAFVEVLRPTMKPPVSRYDVALEACLVRTSDESLRGSLSCPKLQSDRGKATISLQMTWDARQG